MNTPGFFSELRRRQVFKVGAAYVVCAWIAIQAVSIAFPAFDAPPWALRVVILLALLGFPAALVMAWVFEVTPEGLRLDSKVSGTKRVFATAGALAALALGWYFFGQPAIRAPSAVPPANAAAEMKAPAARLERGVAVLPFSNFSPDPANAFFASGIFDEVLTRVSRIDGLKVISRTSMERIASDKLEVPQIGQRLGVSHVLEGSVQRAGDRVRINVQLIDAATDRHVWAEDYDRKLDDVFAIQSEIALAIANQLKIELSPKQEATLGERPTDNREAHDLYLRALNASRTWRGPAGFRDQIALLEPAVAKDPKFLQARELLVEAYGRMVWFDLDPDGAFKAKANAQLKQMQAQAPDRLETRQARAHYLYTVEREYEAALALYQPLAQERPNDNLIWTYIAGCFKRLGRYPEQLVAARRARAIDPESSSPLVELMLAEEFNGMHAQSIALGEEGARLFPGDQSIAMQLAYEQFAYGHDEKALRNVSDEAILEQSEYAEPVSIARFVAGDVDGAVAALEPSKRNASGTRLVDILVTQSDLYAMAGRAAEASKLASQALATARKDFETRKLDGDPAARRFAWASAAAAQAGEAAQARRWREQANAIPLKALESQLSRDEALAVCARYLGELEAAWSLLERHHKDSLRIFQPGLPALRPYFDAQFGKSPGYRAYLARSGGKSG
jgi:TolB-like protein